MDKVLFACVRNAGHSQIAAAFFNAAADPKRARAIPVGTDPARRVHATVVDAMREAGFDLGRVKPRRLDDEALAGVTLLVTFEDVDGLRARRGVKRLDWPFADPSGQPIESVRQIREEIREKVWNLIAEQGWGRP